MLYLLLLTLNYLIMEIKKEVKPIMVNYECDKCEFGYMVHLHQQPNLSTFPAKYPHKCDNCGNIDSFTGVTYPYITYEEK